jgi:uncharacterized caspase-like protein
MKNTSFCLKARVLIATAIIALFFVSTQTSTILVTEAQTQNQRRLVQQSVKTWPSTATRHALVIGVDEYQDSQINRLSGASNDAKALASALVNYAGFPNGQVTVLATDQPAERQPTRGNILRRLSNLLGTMPRDGLLLVSFAGHGIERGGRAYLLPTDAQVNNDINLVKNTAIDAEELGKQIRESGVKQVVMILDACRNDPMAGRGQNFSPLTTAFTRAFNFEARNSAVEAFITLYATALGQVAYEYKEKNQGYFTWALIEGLKGSAANEKGEVTLAELVKYVQEEVPKRIAQDLGKDKKQRPFAIIEGYKANDLVIAVAAPSKHVAAPLSIEAAESKAPQNARDDVPALSSEIKGISTEPPAKIKLFVEEWSYYGNNKSKFSSLAFEKAGSIVKISVHNSFSFDPNEGWSAAIVETLGNGRKTLEDVRRLVEQGGKAVMFIRREHSKYNGDFQELFSISVAGEWSLLTIPATEEKIVSFKGEDYCPLFKGLNVIGGMVVPDRLDNLGRPMALRVVSIQSYLITVGEGWVRSFLTVKGEKKCLSAWRRLGKGEILFLVSFDGGSNSEPFLKDGYIEIGENNEAAMRLARWLAGKSPFPISR